MRDAPSAELIELLTRLQLASPQQVRAVRRYAQSLARDMPLFDSVWVDALMRRRVLTPFQAAEINAGRGDELALGPVILQYPPERLGYANQYLARDRISGEQVRVVVASLSHGSLNEGTSEQLKSVAEQLERARQAETALGVQPILDSGEIENKLWILQPLQNDISLREWMLRGGRLTAEFVLEIARQVSAELAALEKFSLLHGDISSASIRIDESGRISVGWVGLRSVVRSGEGYAHTDLSPESYDYLAPERISAGTPATIHSDLYACGCLWWQLLTGRPPLGGGDGLAKIKAAHAARITPLIRLAPETPAQLTAVINRLIQPDPHARGESFCALSAELGPPSPAVQQRLADCYQKFRPWTKPREIGAGIRSPEEQLLPTIPSARSWFPTAWNLPSQYKTRTAISAALACCCLMLLAAWFYWPAVRGRESGIVAHNGKPAETPGILSASQIEDAKSVASLHGEPSDENLSNVRTVSNTADLAERVTTTVHNELVHSESGEDPSRSMKVVRQILPIREIVLATDRVVQASNLELHVGMRLAPGAGARARVQVPAGGWHIDVEDVRFENIDFILPAEVEEKQSGQTYVVLKASAAQFHGCTFQVAEVQQNPSSVRTTAIRWIGAQRTESLDRLPAAGHLLLANCFFSNIYTGVDGRLAGPMLLELDNVLFAAPREAANSGSLWRIESAPTSEDTFILRMNACTVRDAMALVDIYYPELPSEPGKIKFETIDCVFSLRSTGALLRMIGPYRPDRLMRSVAWGGRGSLLPVQGRFGLWYDAQGSPHAIDDTGVEIDGLVRGGVEFAEQSSSKPQDSVLTHWAAPLIGDAQPGVRVSALPGDSRK